MEPIKQTVSDDVDFHEVSKDFGGVVYSHIVQQKPKGMCDGEPEGTIIG